VKLSRQILTTFSNQLELSSIENYFIEKENIQICANFCLAVLIKCLDTKEKNNENFEILVYYNTRFL